MNTEIIGGISVRQYENKDRAEVERICASTSDTLFAEAVIRCFCAYYIENTPDCCFVAVNDCDKAIGYVLCAPDFNTWRTEFKRDYIDKSDNPYVKAIGEATVLALEKFSDDYPAHLHIDIADGYRGRHIGSRLIDCLKNKLIGLNVRGVMLDVAHDNLSAQKFYIKQGFTPIFKGESETVMGMKL